MEQAGSGGGEMSDLIVTVAAIAFSIGIIVGVLMHKIHTLAKAKGK